MTDEEAQKIVSIDNAALLLKQPVEGEKPAVIEAVAAGKLLGKISTANMGQGGFSYVIPKDALTEAGVDLQRWEKAEKIGMVTSSTDQDGKTQFALPSQYAAGENFVVNTLVQHLETISGVAHKAAQETAAKYAAPKGDKARGA